jgi:proline iminopeptidase
MSMSTSGRIYGRITDHGLFADIRGDDNNPAMLFLHGGPGQGAYEFMALQGDRLSSAVHLIGLDQRGVDRSSPLPPPENLTIADIVDDCERVRHALGIDKWVVLGQSFGGMFALRYATSYPDSVRAVIFENPVWDMTLSVRAGLARLADMLGRELSRDGAPREVRASYIAALNALGDAREEYFVPSPDTRRRLRDIRAGHPAGDEPSESTMRHHRAILADDTVFESLLPLLAELQMPALLVTGGLDPTTSPEQRAAFDRIRVPHAAARFEHAGHFVHADQPDAYAQAVIDFISGKTG